MNTRYFLKAMAALAVAALPCISLADTWPSKPLKLIVPFGAGGTSDIAARIIADKLGARLGQPVIVENKAGVSGVLGTELVAKSPADGYTLLLTSIGPTAFAPSTPKKLGYDPVQDFIHVGLVGSIPLVLVVNNDFAPKTMEELINAAKSKPGSLNFGSSGPASPSHVMLERFKTRFNLDIVHIPFRQGTPATLNEIIAGRVDGSFDSMPAMVAMIKAGRVRPIAVSTPQRSPLLPNVPTMAEAGYSDMTAVSWFGLAVPAGTPTEIAQKINTELNQQLRADDVRVKLQELSFSTSTLSLDEMKKFVVDEIEKWRPAVQAAKIAFQ